MHLFTKEDLESQWKQPSCCLMCSGCHPSPERHELRVLLMFCRVRTRMLSLAQTNMKQPTALLVKHNITVCILCHGLFLQVMKNFSGNNTAVYVRDGCFLSSVELWVRLCLLWKPDYINTQKFLPSRACAALNLVAIPKSADTMKRAALPSGSIWRLTTKCDIKTIRQSDPDQFFFLSLPFFNFSFGVPPCHSGKKPAISDTIWQRMERLLWTAPSLNSSICCGIWLFVVPH